MVGTHVDTNPTAGASINTPMASKEGVSWIIYVCTVCNDINGLSFFTNQHMHQEVKLDVLNT